MFRLSQFCVEEHARVVWALIVMRTEIISVTAFQCTACAHVLVTCAAIRVFSASDH